jgi:adenine-specific DNA-methyltransferase
VIGLRRLGESARLYIARDSLGYIRLFDDFLATSLTNNWEDVGGIQSRAEPKVYSVQTATKAIERCILMTTDPGDLVFDPTCGSGTTAYCAEKWGRRWITCDTSRVALAIARQRLLTARYDYYSLADPERGPAGGFTYETVPHITLESIAHNTEIDAIAAKYKPDLEAALGLLNEALGKSWQEWEVPREATGGWPEAAREVHQLFWEAKRKKRQEIDASIQRNAPQETLYDRPLVKRGVVRVSGPFTVEAIPVPAVEDPTQVFIPQFEEEEARARVSDRGGYYLTTMLNLLKQQGGVLFPGGKKMELQNLRLLNLGMLHAEAETRRNGKTPRVALSFGPPYGPVTATQVAEAIPTARNNAYEVLIFAGFSFDPEAQAFVQRAPVKGLEVHFANIAPDVLVGDLLKTTRASQIFTVFGQPDVRVAKQKDTYTVELRGVDIYDPLSGETEHARGEDVAAWFLDTDYDGMTFHLCQAFFPGDADAWDRLQRALRASIAPEAFEQMRGTVSFPFEAGKHRRIAVKVIDFRGNEVVRVMALDKMSYTV